MSEIKRIDILGDILNDSSSGMIRGIDELMKLTHVDSAIPQNETSPKAPRVKKKPGQGKKRKSTHYLTKEVFDNLDEVKEGIRDFLPADYAKTKSSKSRIVESAITVVLHEFEEKGKESALVRELLKKNHEKS